MDEKLAKQILIAIGVAILVRQLVPSTPAPTPDTYYPLQTWAGAGTDPFGMSYTVVGKAARGGL